jgi:DNA-binding winged helix-turn-helix (wHTH) protein
MMPKQKEYRFGRSGEFTFSRSRGLFRRAEPVKLRNLERQLLKCLLDRPREIVRKEEIQAAVWPETIVTDNTLNVLVGRLREVLGDTKRPYAIIKSVAKMGYQIIATPQPTRVAPVARELRRRDASRFVRDVTVPDGSIFEPGEPFEKVWEIQNIGSTAWHGRALRRTGAARGPGQINSDETTSVPDTNPGELCLIRMSLKAPLQPGSYYAEWKMIDSHGGSCFPKQSPLFLRIDVVVTRD